MIQSFARSDLESFFFEDKLPRGVGWGHLRKIVRRKLFALDVATKLSDLKAPPGNQLEALKNNLRGFYSIRVNDQWRVVFQWPQADKGPSNVDVIDYH